MNASTPSFGMALKVDDSIMESMKKLSGKQVKKSLKQFSKIHTMSEKYDCDVFIMPNPKKDSQLIRKILSKGDNDLPAKNSRFPIDALGTWKSNFFKYGALKGIKEQNQKCLDMAEISKFT